MTIPALNNWRLDSATGQRVFVYKQAIEQFKRHALALYPHEACGFFLHNGIFVALDNKATDKRNEFVIDDHEYLRYWPILSAVIHSHTYSHRQTSIDSRAPSYLDLLTQQSLNLPFLICATDGHQVSDPVIFGDNHITPVVGRQFIHNVFDCWELCRDVLQLWHYENFTVDALLNMADDHVTDHYQIKNVARHQDWFTLGHDIFMDHYERLGFTCVNADQLQPGHMVFMRIESNSPNHAGIYLGDNCLLHHLPGRLSQVSPYSRYQRHITHVLTLQT